MQVKLEHQEMRKKYHSLRQRVDASIHFLADIGRIRRELLDRDFLVNLPAQILETLEDRRGSFDDMTRCGREQAWPKQSKLAEANTQKRLELRAFLTGRVVTAEQHRLMREVKDGLRTKVEELEQVEKRSVDQRRRLESQVQTLNQMTRKTSDKIKKLFIKEEVLRKKKNCKPLTPDTSFLQKSIDVSYAWNWLSRRKTDSTRD